MCGTEFGRMFQDFDFYSRLAGSIGIKKELPG